MQPYFANRTFPASPYLQVAILPDMEANRALRHLVTNAGRLLRTYPGIPVLPQEWLHITVQAIWPAEAATHAQRAQLIEALTDAAALLTPVTIQVGSVLTSSSGVVADTHPDHVLADIYNATAAAVQKVFGDSAAAKDSRPAHMALGYCTAATDGDPIQTWLRRGLRPSHAPLTVDALHVLNVTPDPQHALFRWEHIARIPLVRDPAKVPLQTMIT